MAEIPWDIILGAACIGIAAFIFHYFFVKP